MPIHPYSGSGVAAGLCGRDDVSVTNQGMTDELFGFMCSHEKYDDNNGQE